MDLVLRAGPRVSLETALRAQLEVVTGERDCLRISSAALKSQLEETVAQALCVVCGVNKRSSEFDRWCRYCRKDDNAKLRRLDAAIAERDVLRKRVIELERELERVRLQAASQASTDQERIAATETEMRRLVSVVRTQRERVEQALGLDDD
jgi:hypothetical protein